MNERQQYCTLRVGDLFLGIHVEAIQEVLRETAFTPVPLADTSIRGLINLRGQIVTAIDLRRRLDLDDADSTAPTATMVLGPADDPLALVIDSVGDVVEVDDDSFEPPPDTLKGEARRMIEGAHKLESELLLILNLETAMNIHDLSEEAAP